MKIFDKLQFLLTHYTKPELAEKLGVGQASIYRWVSGKSEPTGRTYNAILALYEAERQKQPDSAGVMGALNEFDPTACDILTGQPLTDDELRLLAQTAYKIALARVDSKGATA